MKMKRGFILGLLGILLIAGCASFGLTPPATTGQKIVQAYGDALTATAMIPGLLKAPIPITVAEARSTQDASTNIRTAIDTYWDIAGLTTCAQVAKAAVDPAATAPPPPVAPAVAEPCAGPNGLQVLTAINASLIQIEAFLLAHKGGK